MFKEATVDEALENHLKHSIPTSNASASNIHVDEEMDIDEEEEKEATPITPKTKHEIYELFGAMGCEVNEKLFGQINHVKSMTENEGQSVLEVLRAQRDNSFSTHLAEVFTSRVLSSALHPSDSYTPELVKLDSVLIKHLSQVFGKATYYLGGLKGFFMLGLYIMGSWTANWEDPLTKQEFEHTIDELYIQKHGHAKYNQPQQPQPQPQQTQPTNT